jgi:hypothetical protein
MGKVQNQKRNFTWNYTRRVNTKHCGCGSVEGSWELCQQWSCRAWYSSDVSVLGHIKARIGDPATGHKAEACLQSLLHPCHLRGTPNARVCHCCGRLPLRLLRLLGEHPPGQGCLPVVQ